MKKSLLTQAINIFMAESLYSAKKIRETLSRGRKKKNNADEIKKDLNQAVMDSTDKFQKFQKESEERISKYEKDIEILKLKIATEEKEGESKFKEMASDLEQKLADLNKDLNKFVEEGENGSESFRIQFNNNMDDLGKALANFY